MNGFIVEKATAGDLSAIKGILSNVGLPYEDVGEHLDNFFVARQGNAVIGTVGMEVYNGAALLRSLAVEESQRNKGIAKSLYNKLVEHIESKGIQQVSLLTTTAEQYFARLGFEKVRQENIPAFVKNTKEYRLYCPSHAVCMVKTI